MKLYYAKGACSLASRIVINEIGIECEYIAVDLKTKQTASGENYLSINPKGAVPATITNDGELLTENAVIQQYLADTYNAVSLLPPINNFRRYRVLEWLNYVTTELHKGFGPLFNPAVTQEMREQIIIPLLKQKFSFIDKHLASHHYLLGESFTLPDGYLFVMITWALKFKFNLADWPNVSRYFKEVEKRQSIKQSLTEEGLHPVLT